MRTGLDGEIRSAEILLPNRMIITRAVNFLYPLELPTLQEEKWDGNKEQGLRTFEDPLLGTEIADLNGIDDDKKRKAACIARRRIFNYLRDHGTSVLFCLSPGRLS